MTEINRRGFSAALAAGVAAPWSGAGEAGTPQPGTPMPPAGGLTDVAGLSVGHFTDSQRPTGCTVVLAEAGAVCGVDVRGGAPGTRETDLLDPVNTVQQVHALVLSGGSAFGLDTATGVMRHLEEKGIGFPVGVGKCLRPSCSTSGSATGRSGRTPQPAIPRRAPRRPRRWPRVAWEPERAPRSASFAAWRAR